MIRTLNQRRLEGAKGVDQLGRDPVTGRVVKAGFHDELGGSPFVVVRTAEGREYYGRLGVGRTAPALGKTLTLQLDPKGVAQVLTGQAHRDLSRS